MNLNEQPKIDAAAESHSNQVLELADDFLNRYRQGERPPLREYIQRHPELASIIKEVFPAMAMMENIAIADESLQARRLSHRPRDRPGRHGRRV